MEDKEIEEILKKSAEKVKTKNFSDRWNDISERLQLPQNGESEIANKGTVLVTASNVNIQNKKTKKVIFLICAALLIFVVSLAIVLPITLKKNNELKYFNINELTNITVSESEFYEEIKKSDLEVAKFSGYKYDLYILLYDPNSNLLGGRLELLDEEKYIFLTIFFYVETVKNDFNIGQDYEIYELNGHKINYSSEQIDGFNTFKAKISKGNMRYDIDCVMLDSDIESIFEKIFG